MNWVKVKYRLPPSHNRVNVCVQNKLSPGTHFIQIVFFDGNDFIIEKINPKCITHWMPLPKLPEDLKK